MSQTTNSKILRILFIVFLLFVLIFALIVSYRFEIMNRIQLSRLEKIATVNENIDVYSKLEPKEIGTLNEEIAYFETAFPIVNQFLEIQDQPELDIVFKKGNCSGVTTIETKVITLRICDNNISPIIHEYMHRLFGMF